MQAAVATARSSLTLHRTVASIRSMRHALDPAVKIGFVPTMGALHEGHLSLVKEARARNDIVVASIFVNPTQFGEGEDFEQYPRQLEQDQDLLADLGVDHLFAPDANSMYGKNHDSFVSVEGFEDIAEGKARPGHFRGVATIVTKLFNIVQPSNAYFGQKDAAQCCLIQRIVDDLDMPLHVNVIPTVREPDGLAMSSRNAYLTTTERQAAPVVYRSLCAARDLFLGLPAESSIPAAHIQQVVESILASEPLVSEVQYVAIDNKANMRPIDDDVHRSEGAIISLAVKVGSVRLIDNIVL
ncbi:Pantothenate synthetase [Seminavis robusta]|uniref:Pantoate--beta-alanine ligase n=1 Tax=Seminavis robusta TaxID=568900 RepID=A0A9N8E9G5_9STRA|nr:Pantothenate synthetase [Seminavis robusta]|eukprot:Sro655_g182300.1 Pantothenate synthetase (298) ;mRNA; r:35073-36345